MTRKRRRTAVCARCDGPCQEIAERRAAVRLVRSRTSAATGLTGLDVCLSGNAKITVVGEVSGGITVASMSGNAKIQAGSCAKPTTKTGTITGSAAITGTGC